MKFLDSIKITFVAGNGGSGSVSFFQDWMQKQPHPDGGNGGNGADIILKSDFNVNTLVDLQGKKIIRSDMGTDGTRKKRHGSDAEDICLLVPVGTLILNESQTDILFNFTEDQQEFVLVKGGKGGLGNAGLVSNYNKTVKHSQPGSLGQSKTVVLDLRLLAQVALIGLPNVGKTSLLNNLTASNAQVGNYFFTTLNPNLGVLNKIKSHHDERLIISDLPGIISGASNNRGLGNRFLKHAERSYLLLHVVDLSRGEQNYLSDFNLINDELIKYNAFFAEIPQIVVVNKIDALIKIPDKKIFHDSRFNILDVIFTSTYSRQNLNILAKSIIKELKTIKHETVIEKNILLKQNLKYRYEYHWEKDIRLRKVHSHVWELSGKLMQTLIKKFNLANSDDLLKFNKYLKNLPIYSKLKEQGIVDGDMVYVFNKTFIWKD